MSRSSFAAFVFHGGTAVPELKHLAGPPPARSGRASSTAAPPWPTRSPLTEDGRRGASLSSPAAPPWPYGSTTPCALGSTVGVVFHGGTAVAELKRQGEGQAAVGPLVFHGGTAVAELNRGEPGGRPLV